MPITPDPEDLDERPAGRLGRRPDPRAHAHAALRDRVSSRASAPTRRPSGPAVFRLTDHIERLHNSAKILMHGPPVLGGGARRRDEGHGAPALGPAVVPTCAPSPTTAMARWASTPCRARSTSPSPAGRGAPTSATTRSSRGVRMKISSWTRHDHNTMPPAAKTTGNYVNSSLAKVEALKAGYDEAIMLNPQGLVSRSAPARTSSWQRGGTLITPPAHLRRPRRASRRAQRDGHRRGPRHPDARAQRLPDPERPLHVPRRCSCAAPLRRSRSVNAVDDRSHPVPRAP